MSRKKGIKYSFSIAFYYEAIFRSGHVLTVSVSEIETGFSGFSS